MVTLMRMDFTLNFDPERDIGTRDVPKRRPPRLPIIAALVVLAAVLWLREQPNHLERSLAWILPSPTPSSPPTPSAAIAATIAEEALAEGNVSRALAAWSTAVAQHPDDVEFHIERSRLLSLRRKHDEAVEAARRAVRAAPGDPAAHAALAAALDWAGMPEPAIDSALVALDLDATNAAAHAALSEAYATAGRWDPAIDTARRAVDLDPELPAAQRALGIA